MQTHENEQKNREGGSFHPQEHNIVSRVRNCSNIAVGGKLQDCKRVGKCREIVFEICTEWGPRTNCLRLKIRQTHLMHRKGGEGVGIELVRIFGF